MSMMPDEKVILESDKKDVSLTNFRVRYESKKQGFATVVSIMLESLTSSAITYKSYPWLLAVAAVFVGLAVYISTLPNSNALVIVASVPAVGLVVAYFLTRIRIVSLASPSAAIRFRASGRAAAERFIDAVESAKNDRYLATKK